MAIIKGCLIGAMFIICCSSAMAAEQKCKATPDDYKKVTALLKHNEIIGEAAKVSCLNIVGNYARADYDRESAFLVKSKGNWKAINHGTGIDSDDLVKAGIPKATAEKLIKN